MTMWIGIDVAKRKLDVFALLNEATVKGRSKVLANSPAGFKALIEWAGKQSVQEAPCCVMEATGAYHEALADSLVAAGFEVVIANPARARKFAEGLDILNKTDRVDARALALYGAKKNPARWVQPAPELRTLQALIKRIETLDQAVRREENRLEKLAAQESVIVQSIHAHLIYLGQAKTDLKGKLDDHLDQHPHLKESAHRLATIPGVGEKTALRLTSFFASHRFDRARSAAAFCGLAPLHKQSGVKLNRSRLGKTGQPRLRAALYMSALVATRHNPDVKALYERLIAAGKAKMQALCAAMRKLLHIAFGVFTHGQPYTPHVQPA